FLLAPAAGRTVQRGLHGGARAPDEVGRQRAEVLLVVVAGVGDDVRVARRAAVAGQPGVRGGPGALGGGRKSGVADAVVAAYPLTFRDQRKGAKDVGRSTPRSASRTAATASPLAKDKERRANQQRESDEMVPAQRFVQIQAGKDRKDS